MTNRYGWVLACLIASLGAAGLAMAQEYPPPSDGLRAGADAAARHEGRRLAEIQMQLDTIGLMKWDASLPAGSYDRFYFYGVDRGHQARFGPYPPDVFFRPGDRYFPFLIGGVPYARIAPQSIGQRHMQTGPNRWESHPVYPDDLHPPRPIGPADGVSQPGVSQPGVPQPETPPENLPRPEIPGPREF